MEAFQKSRYMVLNCLCLIVRRDDHAALHDSTSKTAERADSIESSMLV